MPWITDCFTRVLQLGKHKIVIGDQPIASQKMHEQYETGRLVIFFREKSRRGSLTERIRIYSESADEKNRRFVLYQ